MICKKCGAELPDVAVYCFLCGKPTTPRHSPKKRGNGQGSVYKSGDTWTAQVTLYCTTGSDGKITQKRRKKSGFPTKRDALAYIETLRGPSGRRCPTLLEYWELYSGNGMELLSDSKRGAYKIARRRLEDIIGIPMDKLTIADVQNCINANTSSYYPARDTKNLLSNLFQLAMADQFVAVNLAEHITLPRHEQAEPVPFTPDEVAAIWTLYGTGDTFAGYILLMIYSGMMPGELLACRKDQIDADACEIRCAGKKTAIRKAAAIVFPDFLRPVILSLLEYSRGPKLVTMQKDMFYKRYYEALERAHVRPLPPYSCRHTTGTEAARSGVSTPVMQRIMRHATITTTQRYVHLTDTDAHSGINQLPAQKHPEP